MSERTAQEWADYIAAAIKAAEADGHPVAMYNWFCGCSSFELSIGEYGESVEITW